MKKKKVIFTSSMGGHLNELLCLERLIEKYDSLIVTEKTDATEFLKEKYNVRYVPYGTKKNLIKYMYIYAVNWILSLIYVLKFRPDVIVTTGTHTSVPVCIIR